MREVKIHLAKIPCLSFCLIARFISSSLPHLFNRNNAIHTCTCKSAFCGFHTKYTWFHSPFLSCHSMPPPSSLLGITFQINKTSDIPGLKNPTQ